MKDRIFLPAAEEMNEAAQFYEDHCLINVPSRLRTSPQPPL